MKYLAGNTFQMGSTETDAYDDEKKVHPVTLSAFYMSKYEVTVAEYLQFCQATQLNWPEWLEIGSRYHVETGSDKHYSDKGYQRTGSEKLPIVGVSWDNAVAYCKWLSTVTGKTYRLPTESEWEYAARGGESYKYAGSNAVQNTAWYDGNSHSKPHPVGQKQANGFGLYDMAGNVWEWCSDYYGDYNRASQLNPIGASSGTSCVYRGGSWFGIAQYCRVSSRGSNTPAYRFNTLGFRVVCLSL
jgi:formylglycine-generating enzyme